jgi:hypothetical protein
MFMSVPPSSAPSASDAVLHRGLEAWAREHARRYADIGVIDYDPMRYPGQRIETSKSDAVVGVGRGSGRDQVTAMRDLYARTMGAEGAATLTALGTPAVEIKRLLSAGKNVAVLTAHADQLHYIGALCAGFAVALADRDLLARNGTILNKVMSRESFRGTPIEELFRPFGNVYWVIPATASADRWRLPPELVSRINAAALRRVAEDMRAGLLLTFAPSGSAMQRLVDEDGQLQSLVIPDVAPGTANLICRFDAYLVAALWNGRVALGPVIDVAGPERESRARGEPRSERAQRHREIVAHALDQMATLVADLAEVSVAYRSR